jgi:hypothetical protein
MKFDWVDEVVPKEWCGVVLNHEEECYVALCCEKAQREHEVLQLAAALPLGSKGEAPHHFHRVVHWLVLEVEQGSHVYVL